MKFTLLIEPDREEEICASVHEKSGFTAQLENMVLQYNGSDKIPAFREGEQKLLAFSEIECVCAEDGKTRALNRSGEKYLLKYRLFELEKLLPGNFIRINKSALANRERIEKLTAGFNGSVDAVFRCGRRDYVSRRCLAAIRKELGLK